MSPLLPKIGVYALSHQDTRGAILSKPYDNEAPLAFHGVAPCSIALL
jgi:hypothetical protein